MIEYRPQRPASVGLLIPLVVLLLGFTAVPMELRRITRDSLANTVAVNIDVLDIVANVLGYIPFGMVCASRGLRTTIGLAASVSLFAEASQLVSESRSPALIDVVTNMVGALIGFVVTSRWKPIWRVTAPQIVVGRSRSAIAAALALGYVVLGVRTTPLRIEETVSKYLETPRLIWLDLNPRGATEPGGIEAHWTFETIVGDEVLDVSGNRLRGKLVNKPIVAEGIDGRSPTLNGVDQYIDLGNPVSLRLTGSLTISAWIKANAFPADDAAVVSDHSGFGYQLDTTIDRGPRTIGFKLADDSGHLMARYGRTPLALNAWYHIAGVYDAQAQTLNVYLNGKNDNGCLLGTVTSRQQVSGRKVYIGRRPDLKGFEFAGTIDDVRIYSRALTPQEIDADFKSAPGAQSILVSPEFSSDQGDELCPSHEVGDSRTSGFVVAFGVLVAVTLVGFFPAISRWALCLACLFAGLLLVPTVYAAMPVAFKWLLPLLSLAGGSSVAFSMRRRRTAF